MPACDTSQVIFEGVRLRFGSTKTYDELVSAFFDEVGRDAVPIDDVAVATGSWQSYETAVQSHPGPSGFILFQLFNHGAWIKKAGIDRKVLRAIIGNPLIAITMLRHDVTAGLFAPVELLLVEEGQRPHGVIVKPSSVVVDRNVPLALAALVGDKVHWPRKSQRSHESTTNPADTRRLRTTDVDKVRVG
jgi:hypothetical protein